MQLGGYFELELPEFGDQVHRDAMAFQSARACLHAYLRTSRPRRLHIPYFICPSILPAIRQLGIEIVYYRLGEEMLPEETLCIETDERLLLVNYFGLLGTRLATACPQVPRSAVILDNAQALFSPPLPGVAATIYSPRKFLGVTDGGFLYTEAAVPCPDTAFSAHEHLAHLLLRAAGETEAGYRSYQRAEAALDDFEPRAMSMIARRLLSSVDMSFVASSRTNNFNRLHAALCDVNRLPVDLAIPAPLCYPLMLEHDVTDFYRQFHARHIYLPRYWPECPALGVGGQEEKLARHIIYLPVDQRMSAQQVDELLKVIEVVCG
ncbi:hypothetical protein E4634_01890 [Mangrovimicrobium sediminis]|uniref:DegT/DnrJ/EryC1/StrS aminotransferase family protein n=1 Tax=Mangrovimicrobium sediminis TaxID=2562682 RepID=A0A4Z0M7L0_9GAMM|nr:hypothetical protein [Haliea sp. SAOS-164]TGD75662.1 hypothetical protein E4634_01890 [Haliea sp. SAOS-164]